MPFAKSGPTASQRSTGSRVVQACLSHEHPDPLLMLNPVAEGGSSRPARTDRPPQVRSSGDHLPQRSSAGTGSRPRRGKEALFYLNCPAGPPTLRSYFRFTRKQVNRLEETLALDLDELCTAWKEIHGNY